jgi:hypothetical protein
VIQKDAFERLGLRQMLLEPEFLAAVEADVHLIADLIALRSAMPEKTKDTARQVVAKVVKEVMERLESRTVEAIRGALNKQKRTSRPRFSDIDWPRTIRKNLQHWQPDHKTIVPERLVGYGRHARRSNLENVILCVDQSGSMGTSVVYSSIFAAVLASIPCYCNQAGRVRHGDRRPHGGPERPSGGSVRRPARGRHRHQPGVGLLRAIGH